MVYIMSAEERIVQRIYSAGSAGVKKTDLRKELGDIDDILEKVVTNGDVFIDKRSGAYYCWHKSYYVQSLLNSDPRFKLTHDLIRSLESSVMVSDRELTKAIETLANNVSNLAKLVIDLKSEHTLKVMNLVESDRHTSAKRSMSDYEFNKEFDIALTNYASSIGWVELAKIRNELCEKCSLSTDEFYHLVESLVSQHQDRYELSTGGGEGVMVRGLVHGFVRCIR
jgi:hypothetical protein